MRVRGDGQSVYRYSASAQRNAGGRINCARTTRSTATCNITGQQVLIPRRLRIGLRGGALRADRSRLPRPRSIHTALPPSRPFGVANKPEQALDTLRDLLGQLGTTEYHATHIELDAPQAFFIPNSQLKAVRREVIEALSAARIAAHPRGGRKAETTPPPVYPEAHLSFLANVYNQKAGTSTTVTASN